MAWASFRNDSELSNCLNMYGTVLHVYQSPYVYKVYQEKKNDNCCQKKRFHFLSTFYQNIESFRRQGPCFALVLLS